MADAALPVAERWRPELVVQSQLQGAGLLVDGKLRQLLADPDLARAARQVAGEIAGLPSPAHTARWLTEEGVVA